MISSKISSGCRTVRFTPVKNSVKGTTRLPVDEVMTAFAFKQSNAGDMSAHGDALTTLPMTVARLRI